MDNLDDSHWFVTLSPGTFSIIVLVVITICGVVTLFCLFWWFKTSSPQELHCGRCHSVLAMQGVPQPPETAPVQVQHRNYLAASIQPSHHQLSDSRYQSATFQRLGMKGPVSSPGYENLTLARESTLETARNVVLGPDPGQSGCGRVRFPVNMSAFPTNITSFSKKSDSNIVHPKHPFYRTCSTRKKVLPRLRDRESHQPQPHWLDVSQMCRTVLSHISPRQSSGKSGGLQSPKKMMKSLMETKYSVTILQSGAGDKFEEKEVLEHPVAPHNYIHPLNDVERYNELVLKTNFQSQLPPSSPYRYISKELHQNLNSQGTRQSWGSTLPEYNEFLI